MFRSSGGSNKWSDRICGIFSFLIGGCLKTFKYQLYCDFRIHVLKFEMLLKKFLFNIAKLKSISRKKDSLVEIIKKLPSVTGPKIALGSLQSQQLYKDKNTNQSPFRDGTGYLNISTTGPIVKEQKKRQYGTENQPIWTVNSINVFFVVKIDI